MNENEVPDPDLGQSSRPMSEHALTSKSSTLESQESTAVTGQPSSMYENEFPDPDLGQSEHALTSTSSALESQGTAGHDISFSDIILKPPVSLERRKTAGKRKVAHAEIITSSPYKDGLKKAKQLN